jgi:hypothetical protein
MMTTRMYPPQIMMSVESPRNSLQPSRGTVPLAGSRHGTRHPGARAGLAACLVAALVGVGLAGVGLAGEARAQKKVTVFEPKIEGGALTADERRALDGALADALREQGNYQVVPAYERDAILQGEKVTACESADCQVRIGRVLESTYMLHYSVAISRGDEPAAVKKGRKPKDAEPAPAGAGNTTWKFSASLFNVTYMSMAESAQNKEATCAQCSTAMAAQKLSELVKEIVLADTSHARGMMEVVTDPAEGVEVVVDGVPVGFTGGGPMQIKTFAGQHKLILRKPGFRSRREVVAVPEGKGTPLPPFKLVEGRDQVVIVVNEARRGPRPKWRVGLGAAMLVGGLVTMGFGGRMLYLDGRCTEAPVSPAQECDTVFKTTGIGAGLTAGGGVVALVGLSLLAFPGPKLPNQQPAEEPGATPAPAPAAPAKSATGRSRPRAALELSLGGVGGGLGVAFGAAY